MYMSRNTAAACAIHTNGGHVLRQLFGRLRMQRSLAHGCCTSPRASVEGIVSCMDAVSSDLCMPENPHACGQH